MKKFLISIAIFLLFPSLLSAATYYVDTTNGSCSDGGAGTNPAAPWCTIGKAATTMVAGDMVTIGPGGTYNVVVTPSNSGSNGSVITYQAAAGAKPKIRRFNLALISYTTINGLEITHQGMTNDGTESFILNGSDHVRLTNNYIHDTADVCIRSNPSTSLTPSTNLYVGSNTISLCGKATAPGMQIWMTTSLIENNDESHVNDYVRPWGNHNTIRNNTWHDSTSAECIAGGGSAGSCHIDAVQSYCNDPSTGAPPFTYTLIEGNVHYNNPDTDSHFILSNNTTSCSAGTTTIVIRFNATSILGSYCAVSDNNSNTANNWKFYNNTCVGLTPQKISTDTVDFTGATSSTGRNNIFVNPNSTPFNVYANKDGTDTADYDLGYFTTGSVTWGSPFVGEAHGVRNSNPLFVSSTDFHLQSGSPARGAGGPLTTTAGSGSGSTALIVTDAHFFQDGWGTTADCIAVGTVANTACVSSINYGTNTITLASPLTWSNAQSVWLFKNSSSVTVLYGSAPDMGAYPYSNAVTAVSVETAADGSGSVVSSQNVTSAATVIGYCIERGSGSVFIDNGACTWSLTSKTSGVVNGNLVAAGDNKSATFTSNLTGTGVMTAVNVGFTGNSGTLTVVAGAAASTNVETAANGSGVTVPLQNVVAAGTVTGYSITRDAAGNFVANAAATWTLTSKTGGVIDGDLVAAGDTKSAVFTGAAVGSAKMHAVASTFAGDSGVITVLSSTNAANRLKFPR